MYADYAYVSGLVALTCTKSQIQVCSYLCVINNIPFVAYCFPKLPDWPRGLRSAVTVSAPRVFDGGGADLRSEV